MTRLALATLLLAAAASADPIDVRSPVQMRWEPAAGAETYHIEIVRNGIYELDALTSAAPNVWVHGEDGDVVQIEVRGVRQIDLNANRPARPVPQDPWWADDGGPRSWWSDEVRFVPEPGGTLMLMVGCLMFGLFKSHGYGRD